MIRILLLLFLPIVSFGQNTILSGYITDGQTKEPIANASIRLYIGPPVGEFTAQTNNEGYYAINTSFQPLDKDYPVIIQKENFQVIRGVIRLNFGEEPSRDYRLYAVPYQQPETVLQEDEGPSLLGAPANNLTFLIDVSGSMEDENRLENLKESLLYLVKNFRSEDKISIITYSSYAKIVLNNGSASNKSKIEQLIKKLSAGGKTEGYDGLKKAYDLALTNFTNGGNNKIILATDGIFGEDKKSQKEIERLIEKGLGQEVNLSIFSFIDDEKIAEKLKSWANIGDGNYTNITSVDAAKAQIIKEAKGK